MKPNKKIAKKLARRNSGHSDLENSGRRGKIIYPGQYTAPGSRSLKKQG